MRINKIHFFIIVLFISFCRTTPVDAYRVNGCFTSKQGWVNPETEFATDYKAVYFNIETSTDFADEGILIQHKWYRPNGSRENDVGTNLLAHRVYSNSGLLIGFWTYMLINGKDREIGKWRVEHWAYGYSGGVLNWYLMCTAFFDIKEKEAVSKNRPMPWIPLLLLDD